MKPFNNITELKIIQTIITVLIVVIPNTIVCVGICHTLDKYNIIITNNETIGISILFIAFIGITLYLAIKFYSEFNKTLK